MKLASAALVVALACLAAAARGDESVAKRFSAPLGVAEESSTVGILDHSAYWARLYGIGAVAGEEDTPGLLVVRGTVKNRTGRTLNYVKLSYELLDAHGHVLVSEYGYNRNSEVLRELDSPIPWPLADPPHVSIPKDGTDSFRMLFLRSETPPFATYRVRVVEAVAEDE